MDIEVLGIERVERGRIKALAKVRLDGLVIPKWAVVEGAEGLKVYPPSYHEGREWTRAIEVEDKALREKIGAAVLDALKKLGSVEKTAQAGKDLEGDGE